MQGSLKQKFLQNQPGPKADGKLSFGHELGGKRRRHNTRHSLAMAGGQIAGSFVNMADHADFPVDIFRILGAGEYREGFVALRTTLFFLREVVGNNLGWKLRMACSTMAARSWLLTSFLGLPLIAFLEIGNFPLIHKGSAGYVLSLFSLAAKELLLQPCASGFERFNLLGQLYDLGRLSADNLF